MSSQYAPVLKLLDTLVDGFVGQLPTKIRPLARDLPRVLGLTSCANQAWSRAFDSPIALGLPVFLVADSDRPSATKTAHAAGLAHILAMNGALAIARIDDGKIAADSQVAHLIRGIRRAHNAQLVQFDSSARASSWGWAERQTWGAVIEERSVFRGASRASWEHYEAVSLMKQGLWFPACMSASRAGR